MILSSIIGYGYALCDQHLLLNNNGYRNLILSDVSGPLAEKKYLMEVATHHFLITVTARVAISLTIGALIAAWSAKLISHIYPNFTRQNRWLRNAAYSALAGAFICSVLLIAKLPESLANTHMPHKPLEIFMMIVCACLMPAVLGMVAICGGITGGIIGLILGRLVGLDTVVKQDKFIIPS